MNLAHFASSILKQGEELEYYRRRCTILEERLSKYEQHISDELDMWNTTYGNILNTLAGKE